MAGNPLAGIPVPDPITSPHHHVFSLALTLHKEFSGVTGGLVGAAFGVLVLTLLCPREQWRAAAWASPSSVLLC